MDFTTPNYLKTGNKRQQKALEILTNYSILNILARYTPVVTGTIPINIDIETSDIDIICYWENKSEFISIIQSNFHKYKNYILEDKTISGIETILANFTIEDQQIEVFGQRIPVLQQAAYRHMIIEYNLLQKYGDEFRQKIIELKRKGYKTEPAFAMLLGITGNPYDELLKIED